jgi:hypothetical protein
MPLPYQQDRHAAGSFAGLLAALASPTAQPLGSGFDDLLDGLDDDVATLSYERALKTHGRYKPAVPASLAEHREDPGAISAHPPEAASSAAAAEQAWARPGGVHPDLEEDRKRASVTLRMSRADCVRLQQRAAEAGLTVSAYLRFCAFEVESLRGQVKAALAELKAQRPSLGASSGWRRWFRPHGRRAAAVPFA